MSRWLAILVTGFAISACSFNTKAPKLAFSEVKKADDRGFEVLAAYNSSVYRWPGFTWSIAGTYLPGATSLRASTAPGYFFESAGNGAYKLSIAATPECRPDLSATQSLSKSLDELRVGDGDLLPSKGRVDVYVVGPDVEQRRYNVSLSTGRAFRLKYWTPCINGNANAALFYAAMVALHESTHASLDIVHAQSADLHEREQIAVGAEACLYLSLRRNDEAFEQVKSLLLLRFKQADNLGVTSIDLTQLCDGWKSRVSAAINSTTKPRRP